MLGRVFFQSDTTEQVNFYRSSDSAQRIHLPILPSVFALMAECVWLSCAVVGSHGLQEQPRQPLSSLARVSNTTVGALQPTPVSPCAGRTLQSNTSFTDVSFAVPVVPVIVTAKLSYFLEHAQPLTAKLLEKAATYKVGSMECCSTRLMLSVSLE